jgi:hypothetical protein
MARTQSYAGRKSKTTEADKKAAKARKAAKAAAAVDSSDEEAAPAPAGPSLRVDAEVKNVAVERDAAGNAVGVEYVKRAKRANQFRWTLEFGGETYKGTAATVALAAYARAGGTQMGVAGHDARADALLLLSSRPGDVLVPRAAQQRRRGAILRATSERGDNDTRAARARVARSHPPQLTSLAAPPSPSPRSGGPEPCARR